MSYILTEIRNFLPTDPQIPQETMQHKNVTTCFKLHTPLQLHQSTGRQHLSGKPPEEPLEMDLWGHHETPQLSAHSELYWEIVSTHLLLHAQLNSYFYIDPIWYASCPVMLWGGHRQSKAFMWDKRNVLRSLLMTRAATFLVAPLWPLWKCGDFKTVYWCCYIVWS